jgi:uncharacterized membrane protein
MNKQRLTNYGLWVALIALGIDIGVYSGLIPVTESAIINGFGQRILELLVITGILSNPTKPEAKGFNL